MPKHSSKALAWLALMAGVSACESPVEAGLFGLMGALSVQVDAPITNDGSLTQTLAWFSDGAWRFEERISYRGLAGDQHVIENRGLPSRYEVAYAQVIAEIGVGLDGPIGLPAMDTIGDVICPKGKSRVTVEVADHRELSTRRWVRCAFGALGNLTPGGAGPDLIGSRVASVAIRARRLVLGQTWQSVYSGSIPFLTLEKGDQPGFEVDTRAFVGSGGEPPPAWSEFWDRLSDEAEWPVSIDWSNEFVLVASGGTREEAGDSVEVRRVLRTLDETRVEAVLRTPGHFCAPAARRGRPYHVVLAPKSLPVHFRTVVERVSCWGS